MENKYTNMAASSGAMRPSMLHSAQMAQNPMHAQQMNMMNAAAAAKVQRNMTAMVKVDQQEPAGAKTDKKTLGTFLMGALAAWALLPADGANVPKPKVTLNF